MIGLTGSGDVELQRSSLCGADRRRGRDLRARRRCCWRSRHTAASCTHAEGLLLGLAAGALFGVSDVAIKYLAHADGPVYGLISPWTLTALVAGVIAFYASARSLQLGPGVEVIAFTSVAANLAAILGGIIVFDEHIGSGAVAIGARFIAFFLVIAGAALMPGRHTELPAVEAAPSIATS